MDTQTESQGNDLEIMRKKEDEHFRLQRQFRVIQMDRLNRTMGVHPQFRRQDLLLKTLKKEYINLNTDLKIARSGAHKKNDKRMKAELRRTLLLRMKTEQQCEGGSTMMAQLDGLLQRDHRDLQELKNRAVASRGAIKERRLASERRLVATENKLEAANLRFNAVQCENKRIREQIEHMLQDRAIFNKDWSKMMTALKTGKKFLTDLFESSTVAYDQRDEWCTKLKSMTEKGRMDQMLQVQEMRDLQKAFDHEMKMYNFLAKKGVMRVNRRQERREEERKRALEEKWQKDLDYHINILHDIHDYTKELNPDRIIHAFQKVEQENFSMYKLMMEYCVENEVLTRQVNRIRQEIADRKDQNESQEVKRQQKLQTLAEELEDLRTRNELLRSRKREKDQLVDGTMDKIHDIFKMLNLSLEPFQNLLGEKQPSLQQLGLTLCLINDRVKELVEIVYYYERCVQKKEKSTSRLKKYTVHTDHRDPCFMAPPVHLLVPADPCPACTEARWLSKVSDTQEFPLSRSEALTALHALNAEPAYERSDRVHALTDCRLPASRLVLAKRYM
ncbi:coiled-coil domain-containing protein 63-like [Choristoneura fumiferana]|uniref:coiled-coil domain-containing protein 63-like n=1 Tax=Choristoneura fumiferana TaxID=7141 RepID=UPI003D15C34D